MANEYQWKVSGLYFEACNCESVCPCYSGQAPSHGYCEGPCVWHIQSGHFNGVPLDGLNVLFVQRCEGHMRETTWRCRFYLDDRATDAQFQGLQHIFATGSRYLPIRFHGGQYRCEQQQRQGERKENFQQRESEALPCRFLLRVFRLSRLILHVIILLPPPPIRPPVRPLRRTTADCE